MFLRYFLRSGTVISSSLGMLLLPSVTFFFEGSVLGSVTFYVREWGV
jgi:hypothetical protein